MPNKQDTINIINNALQSDNKKVIVLKGDWGIGKTYLWKEEIQPNLPILQKCGYVSLFGKSSIQEINRAALTTVYLANKIESKKTKVRKFLHLADKFTKENEFEKLNFAIQGIDALLSIINKENLKNTIICFDDLERMDSNIDFKDFLGFVNDLAEHQECKVVLIFNEDELFNLKSKSKEVYSKFKEKTIDLEVTYTPTFEDNFNIACNIINHNLEDKYRNTIKDVLNELKENNIRIISKCIECINDFIQTVENIKHKIDKYDEFSNTILLKLINSITYITQQYWKAGHRFWDNIYTENYKKEKYKNNHDLAFRDALKTPTVYQGKYLETLDTYFQGYKFNEHILYNYLKDYDLLVIYYNFEKQKYEYEEFFWNTIDGKFDDYINNMCNLFKNEDNAYSFFINMSYPALQSYLHDSTLLKNSNIFKEIFYKQMSYAVDRYIEEYQNNFDIKYNFDMIEKIRLVDNTKTALLYKNPKDLKGYYDCLLYVTSEDYRQSCKYVLEQINFNKYKELCNANNEFFIHSKSLFFERNKYDIESKIPHFLYIVAKYLLETIERNPDNEMKYDEFGKIHIGKNDNNYSAKEDLNTYITQYQNNNQENE